MNEGRPPGYWRPPDFTNEEMMVIQNMIQKNNGTLPDKMPPMMGKGEGGGEGEGECHDKSAAPTLGQTAFNVVEEVREIWSKLNTTLIREDFNPLISEFVELTYREFMRPNAWTRPFSV